MPGLVTLLFIVLYKLPDSLTDNMKTSFLLKTGFSQTEIGAVLGFAGIVATIVGGVLAGAVIVRLGVNKSLWVFAVFQALSNVSYYVLALAGKSHALMVTAVITENFGLGMVSAGLARLHDGCLQQAILGHAVCAVVELDGGEP